MSTQIVIGTHELERLITALGRPDQHVHEMLDAIGQQQEDSARRRIDETKRGPDGRLWAPWSTDYAKTRGGGHSLLRDEDKLYDSLDHQVTSEHEVAIGSVMHYAGYLQGGTKKKDNSVLMPARPFLNREGHGIEDSSDRREIRDIVRDFFDREIAP